MKHLFDILGMKITLLQEEAEKRRVLEDALHVLAREHFVLEQSIRSQNKLVSFFREFMYNDTKVKL